MKEMKPDAHDCNDTDLSLPLKSVALGEHVIIAEAGDSAAKTLTHGDQPKRRFWGSAKGEFIVPDDFNDPLPKEIEDLFW